MGAILDQFGREIETQPERLGLSTRDIVTSSQDWASVGSVLGKVTPAAILATFADADNGFPGRQIELAQDIRERDDHVSSMDQTRRLAVMNMDYLTEPGDDSNEAQKAAAAWKEEWEELGPRDIIENMMDAVLDQWSIQRVIWDTNASLAGVRRYRPIAVEEVDARRMCWPQSATSEAGDISVIVPNIMRNWNSSDVEPLTPGKFLWHSYRAKMGRPGKGALIRCIAVYWMFKRFALTDIAALLEQWGRPWPSVKYDSASTSLDEVRKWIDAMVRSMAKRVIAMPKGAELEVHDAAATGADTPHLNMVRVCNEGISKAIIGSTTIAEAAANNDSVSSPTHAQVREDIRNADAYAIAASIRRNLIIPWTLWNYGPNVAPPKYSPNTAPKIDPGSRSKVFLDAGTLSLTVDSDQLYSELKLKKPDGVPDQLKLQPAGGLPAFPGLSPLPSGEAPATPAAPVSTDQKADVLPDFVLNGAQIQAATGIVEKVARSELPRDAGVGQLIVLFNLKPDQAEQIMGSAGKGFTPARAPVS